MRYFKGSEKETGRHVFFRLYDEPQYKRFGLEPDTYIMEGYYLEKSGTMSFATVEDCQKDHYILREISDAEFDLYSDIQRLLTEVYMNQFTGGFPNDKNSMDRMLHLISTDVRNLKNVFFGESDKPSGKPSGIYNG